MPKTPKLTPGQAALEAAALEVARERDALEYETRTKDLAPERVAEIEEAARYCQIPPLVWLRNSEKRSRWGAA